jgi:type II secretory pathway pseudopilin PulG
MKPPSPLRPISLKHRRHGLTLIDMLIAIGLISIFSVLAVKLVATSMRVSNEATRTQDLSSRFDSAVSQLRRDVWGAAKLESPDGKSIQISRDGEPAISWKILDDGTISRVAPDVQQQWAKVGAGMTVKIEGSLVILAESESDRAPRRIALLSRVVSPEARVP